MRSFVKRGFAFVFPVDGDASVCHKDRVRLSPTITLKREEKVAKCYFFKQNCVIL